MAFGPVSARVARESAVAYLAGAFERPPARVLLRRALAPPESAVIELAVGRVFRSGAGQVAVWGTATTNDSGSYPAGRLICGCARQAQDVKRETRTRFSRPLDASTTNFTRTLDLHIMQSQLQINQS